MSSRNRRTSLCHFIFADGRRCATPRLSSHPDFCHYHAQLDARAKIAEELAGDLAFFFSSDYLSAHDLLTALGRIFVASARGDIKPRTARTLAYLAQTMLQTLHLAQNEFISACGKNQWNEAVLQSLQENFRYRFPNSPSAPASDSTSDPPPGTNSDPTPPSTPPTSAPPTPSTPPPPTPNPSSNPLAARSQHQPEGIPPASSGAPRVNAALAVARALFPPHPQTPPEKPPQPHANHDQPLPQPTDSAGQLPAEPEDADDQTLRALPPLRRRRRLSNRYL